MRITFGLAVFAMGIFYPRTFPCRKNVRNVSASFRKMGVKKWIK